MHNDLRTTERRSGRLSIEPFEVDESRFKNIGKRTGKVFVKKNDSSHYDGLRRFSDLLSTSQQDRLNKQDTLKEKDEEIIQNIFDHNCQKQIDLPNISGISSIKKRRSMLNIVDKCTTGDLSIIKMLGDRNRESLDNLSRDLEQQSQTIQQFHFRQITNQEAPEVNQNRLSIDKLIDDLDCLTQKQQATKNIVPPNPSAPAQQNIVGKNEKIVKRKIEPTVILRRSQRTSILPYIDEKEVESSDRKESKNILMENIEQLEIQIQKLDVPRKVRKESKESEKVEFEKQPDKVVENKVQIIPQKRHEPLIVPQKQQLATNNNQIVQPQKYIDEHSHLQKQKSQLQQKFQFEINLPQELEKKQKIKDDIESLSKEKPTKRRRNQSRNVQRKIKETKPTKQSKASVKRNKRQKMFAQKEEDYDKIGGFVPLESIIREDQDPPISDRYPQRNRLQPVKYWENERVVHSKDGDILGVANNPHIDDILHAFKKNSKKSSRHKSSPKRIRDESVEKELGIRSDHKLVKENSNIYKFELKPQDIFTIKNGKFDSINIVIIEAKRNKVVYSDSQGNCKIKDYLIVEQIHNFTLRNNSSSQKAIIQLEIRK